MRVKFNYTEYRAFILPSDDTAAQIVGSAFKEGRAKKKHKADVKKMFQADYVMSIEHLGVVANVSVETLLENVMGEVETLPENVMGEIE